MEDRNKIFNDLLEGNWQAHFTTKSDADIAFCLMVAKDGSDADHIDGVFRFSKLYDETRDTEVYRKVLVEKAIAESMKAGTDSINGEKPWYTKTRIGYKFYAGVLARHLKENVKAIFTMDSFHIYDNGVYRSIDNAEASRIVKSFMDDECCTMTQINDTREQWKLLIKKDDKQLNPTPNIINLKNGLLDVSAGEFRPHDPDFLSTVQLNVNFNPKAKCDQFLNFMKEMLPEESIALMQEIMGYLLIPETKAQKCFVLIGPPRTGKSTVIWVIESILLGKENCSNIPWQELGDRFKTAELCGKLCNLFADLPSKAIEDSGLFKSITGEDTIIGERKFGHPFSFKPTARLLFSCNKLPWSEDQSGAFYRRIITIPFERQVSEDKIDPELRGEKLTKETDGIFMWALEGLRRLIRNNFAFTENEYTRKRLEQYRQECSSVLSFVSERCVFNDGLHIGKDLLYGKYSEYCYNSGLKAVSRIRFNNELENNFKGIQLGTIGGRDSRKKAWLGIGLAVED